MEFVRGTFIIMKTAKLIVNLPINTYNLGHNLIGYYYNRE